MASSGDFGKDASKEPAVLEPFNLTSNRARSAKARYSPRWRFGIGMVA